MRGVAVSLERVWKCLIAGLFAAIVIYRTGCIRYLPDHNVRLEPRPTTGIFASVKYPRIIPNYRFHHKGIEWIICARRNA
jgi:hypothetical protein